MIRYTYTLLICFSVFKLADAMQVTPVMDKKDIEKYVANKDWFGFEKALESCYVRPVDMLEYSKEDFDQPYISDKPNAAYGKTLFQTLFSRVYSRYKSENHYRLLEGLIFADKVTHNAQLALTAIFPIHVVQYIPGLSEECMKVFLKNSAQSPVIGYYRSMINNINQDIAQIQKYVNAAQWKELVHYAFDRELRTEFFIKLPSPFLQHVINSLVSELAMPNIPVEKRNIFISLKTQLTVLLEKRFDKNIFIGIPVLRDAEQTYASLVAKLFTLSKPWIFIVGVCLGLICYQRVTSGRAQYAENMIINETESEITITDHEGHALNIAVGNHNVFKLPKTTGTLILKLSDARKDSAKNLKIDLSKYEDVLDDYFINITIRPTRWYERLFVRAPLTYLVSWKRKV